MQNVPADPIASVVIPAHNEAAVIERLLHRLDGVAEIPAEVIVVCNGCTDDTAAVARATGIADTVLELGEASKQLALERGDEVAVAAVRVYVDADVVIDAGSIAALIDALRRGEHLAAGPCRRIPLDRSHRLVRWYYSMWERLPAVDTGLFGRGVVALSEPGRQRVREHRSLMGDDLVASEVFEPDERTVVETAVSTIVPPRTVSDLVRRRARAAAGNAQADQHGVRRPESITSVGTVISLVRSEPRLAVPAVVFVGVAVAARVISWQAVRTGDFRTWKRDESSRRR